MHRHVHLIPWSKAGRNGSFVSRNTEFPKCERNRIIVRFPLLDAEHALQRKSRGQSLIGAIQTSRARVATMCALSQTSTSGKGRKLDGLIRRGSGLKPCTWLYHYHITPSIPASVQLRSTYGAENVFSLCNGGRGQC